MFTSLLRDEGGFVVSAELVLVSTVLILGLIVGLSEVQHALNAELNDVGDAIGSLNQSYYFSGFSKVDRWQQLHAFTNGSYFADVVDDCDYNQCDIACDAAVLEAPKYGDSCDRSHGGGAVISGGHHGGRVEERIHEHHGPMIRQEEHRVEEHRSHDGDHRQEREHRDSDSEHHEGDHREVHPVPPGHPPLMHRDGGDGPRPLGPGRDGHGPPPPHGPRPDGPGLHGPGPHGPVPHGDQGRPGPRPHGPDEGGPRLHRPENGPGPGREERLPEPRPERRDDA